MASFTITFPGGFTATVPIPANIPNPLPPALLQEIQTQVAQAEPQAAKDLALAIKTKDFSAFNADIGKLVQKILVDFETFVCFAAGTRIRTARGDVAVEHLEIGDLCVTASGARRPIRWIGHRDTDCRHHPEPRKVWPVRVRAGTLAGGLPYADLWLSPGHALCIDDLLIPVRGLIDGDAVAQIERDSVTYWHVELDNHDILLANGAPAESYLDTSNRSAFDNAPGPVDLHPDFDARDTSRFCRPYVESGALLTAVRLRLFGASTEPATEPVHMLADGTVLRGMVSGHEAIFVIPAGTRELSLVSPRFEPGSGDLRTLGVIVNAVAIEADGAIRRVALDDPGLGVGFHAIEAGDGRPWRWTDGAGHFDASLWAACDGGVVLRIGGKFDVAWDGIAERSIAA